MKPIRVLVIDDSALMRGLLTEILSQDPRLQVVGAAGDPIVAWRKIQELEPDVLTLDIEMPRMDGLTFLEKLMRLRPLPVVMVSSQTRAGAEPTLRALELGAVDFVPKPTQNVLRDTSAMAQAIAETVVQAARARLGAPARRALGTARGSGPAPAGQRAPAPRPAPPAQTPIGPSAPLRRTAGRQHRWLALGASTGGTEALRTLLCALPADLPPVVVVQHMPEHFTAAFARRLSTVCPCAVREAQDGDRLERGLALVAPGGRQMEVAESGGVLRVRLSDDPPVNRHRPSVDTLFLSLAQVAGADGVAALLTGMGDDGARGLLALRRAGSHTIAQDEASSVVYGMPRVAAELGAAVEILPLERIAAACLTGATKAA